ncbi:hypothetical protein B0J12DRAFT_691201 [Macrophomina phaseolina]|uniref:Uncharacterized protein n=1 Tax=Macrophomina phaseolina TaxID=35725 RepID=A0ABQ8FT08_9PEZI|nr:hypothetical protein B0J12DRAFT_691201 [Macrophomina phaseolina]
MRFLSVAIILPFLTFATASTISRESLCPGAAQGVKGGITCLMDGPTMVVSANCNNPTFYSRIPCPNCRIVGSAAECD